MITIYEKDGVICAEGYLETTGRKIFVYLVDGMLIDTAPQTLEEEMISFYQEHSFELVALTHSHEDHSGTAAWIQENRDVPIFVHPKGIDICALPGDYPKYRQKTWGIRQAFEALPLGDVIRSRHLEWQVIYTPGHADDHVAFFHEETGRLFAGDLFVQTKTKISMETESIPVIMASLRRLLALDIKSMYCSHSGYHPEGKKTLQDKLTYLEDLSATVKSLHREGIPAEKIADRLFPKKYPLIAVSNGEWDSVHLVNSILSELVSVEE